MHRKNMYMPRPRDFSIVDSSSVFSATGTLETATFIFDTTVGNGRTGALTAAAIPTPTNVSQSAPPSSSTILTVSEDPQTTSGTNVSSSKKSDPPVGAVVGSVVGLVVVVIAFIAFIFYRRRTNKKSSRSASRIPSEPNSPVVRSREFREMSQLPRMPAAGLTRDSSGSMEKRPISMEDDSFLNLGPSPQNSHLSQSILATPTVPVRVRPSFHPSPPSTVKSDSERGSQKDKNKQARADDIRALDRLIAALDDSAGEEKERRRTMYSDAASGKTFYPEGYDESVIDNFPLPNAGLFRAALGSTRGSTRGEP